MSIWFYLKKMLFLAFSTPSASRAILRSTAKRLPKSPTVTYLIFIYSDCNGLSVAGIAIGFYVGAMYFQSTVTGMLVDNVGRIWWKGDIFCEMYDKKVNCLIWRCKIT